MNLNHLSNEELHGGLLTSVAREHRATLVVLWHLREVERRMLYARMGYRDLKSFCVSELKYSEGSAWRRIDAMRVLKDVPEVEAKLQTGELNLTQVTMAQQLFRAIKPTAEGKREILGSLTNQSKKQTERILAELQPEIRFKPEVSERAVKGKRVEVTLLFDEELQQTFAEIELLLGKKLSKLEMIKLLASEKLEQLRKQQAKAERKAERKAQPLRSRSTAKVSRVTVRELKKSEPRCRYRDSVTGRQCDARHNLQVEHIVPRAKGGSHDISNLELLCPAHNRLRAAEQFGFAKMRRYVPSLN